MIIGVCVSAREAKPPPVCCVYCSVPTLYLSECVLIYLEPGEAEAMLAAAAAMAAEAAAPAAVAIYEQTRPDDAFGATMIANLEVRSDNSLSQCESMITCMSIV